MSRLDDWRRKMRREREKELEEIRAKKGKKLKKVVVGQKAS